MNLYEKYHSNRKAEKRIIKDKDFTHRLFIQILSDRLSGFNRVLDIGCGTGTMSFYFSGRGIDTIGIDVSKNAIEIAKRNAKKLGLSAKTKFFVADFPKSKPSGQFDLIICTEVLEHLKDDSKAISEIHDLLKKGGMVLFSSPLNTSVLYRLNLTTFFDKDVGHLRRYDEMEFIRIIKKSGLDIVKVKKAQGLLRDFLFVFPIGNFFVKFANRFSFLSDTLTFIDNLLLPLGAADIIVLAKK